MKVYKISGKGALTKKQSTVNIVNLIELIVEGEGEDSWADDLCDKDAHEEEQIAIQGSLDGGKLVLCDLGVEADLGLGAGVHADRVHLPGVLEESPGQEEVLIAAKKQQQRKN